MKIHWLSPLLPAKTGVAHYSRHILPRLAELAEVVVFTPQESWDPEIESSVRVRSIGQEDRRFWRELHEADLTICHLGRPAPFHGAIVEIARRHPSLVVLHESRLFGLLTDALVGIRGQVDRFLEICKAEAGRPGFRVGERWLRGESALALEAELPLTSFAIEGALGVMVHSCSARQDVERVAPPGLPLLEMPLPWPADEARTVPPGGEPAARAGGRLVVFGHCGSERRLDLLLEALASSPLRQHLQLDIYGELREPEAIVRQRDRLGLQPQVTFHGYVLEEKLVAALHVASLGIDLRTPCLGGASLVRLEMWRQGLAVAGTPAADGCDEDALLPIREGREREDLERAFAASADQGQLAELAERGRQLLRRRHDPALLAEALLAFGEVARGQVARCLEQRWRRRASRVVHLPGRHLLGSSVLEESARSALEAILDPS